MRVVRTTQDLNELCSSLARHPYVAVDTEFLREQTFYSVLCLVQLAGPDDEAIVDPLAPGIDLAPFWALMANPGVVKVFHSGRQDIEIVWHKAKLIPTPVFDTQVAAMVCGFGEAISYVNLVKQTVGADLDKSSRFTDWSRRPLSKDQMTYALGDVTHLRGVYQKLKLEIEASGRESWVDEEMQTLTDPATYDTRPEEAWRRLKLRVKSRKALAVLIELAAWRDELAQRQDVPRQRVLRDEVLYDIANQMPTDTEKLGQLRSLSEGFARSSRAKDLVDRVKAGLARDPKTLPAMPTSQQLPPSAVAITDLLRVLLKSAAARNRVAPRLIADSEDLERIAVEDVPDVPALKGWRRALFGEDALGIKTGRLALIVTNGEVVVLPQPRAT
jgi:ribonuclease D